MDIICSKTVIMQEEFLQISSMVNPPNGRWALEFLQDILGILCVNVESETGD